MMQTRSRRSRTAVLFLLVAIAANRIRTQNSDEWIRGVVEGSGLCFYLYRVQLDVLI
jgi:hypothetical protein